MATWNELFLDEKFITALPQPEVYKFIKKLEGIFVDRPLSLWDFCCGAGRHTVLMAQMGHRAYGSDAAENGISHAQKWLESNGLKAELIIPRCVFMGYHRHSELGGVLKYGRYDRVA